MPLATIYRVFNTFIQRISNLFQYHRLLACSTESEVRYGLGIQHVAIASHHVLAFGCEIQRFGVFSAIHLYIQVLAFQLVGITHEIDGYFFIGFGGGVIHTHSQAGRLFHILYGQVIHIQLSLGGEAGFVGLQGNAFQLCSGNGHGEIQYRYRPHALEGIVHATLSVGGSLGSQVVVSTQVSHAVIARLLLVGVIHGHLRAVQHDVLDEGEIGIVLVAGFQCPCTSVEGSLGVTCSTFVDGEIDLCTLGGQDADAVAYGPFEFQFVIRDRDSCSRTSIDAVYRHFGDGECTQGGFFLRIFFGNGEIGLVGTGTEREHRHDGSPQIKIQIFHAVVHLKVTT